MVAGCGLSDYVRGVESGILEFQSLSVFRAGPESLVSELQNAHELSDAAKDSEQFAYVQALLDALIVSGATVPGDAVLPFIHGHMPECLILLARSGAEEQSLLLLRDRNLDVPEWLLVSTLLLRVRSGQFIADVILDSRAEHAFIVSDPVSGGIAGKGPAGVMGFLPDTALGFPAGFPPIGVYELCTVPVAGDTLVVAARHPVYYRRTVPASGSVRWTERNNEDPRYYGIDFLADASGMDANVVRPLFAASTFVLWTDVDTLKRTIEEALSAQEAGIRKFVESAKHASFRDVPPLHLRIVTTISDHRTKSHERLPALSDRSFVIE